MRARSMEKDITCRLPFAFLAILRRLTLHAGQKVPNEAFLTCSQNMSFSSIRSQWPRLHGDAIFYHSLTNSHRASFNTCYNLCLFSPLASLRNSSCGAPLTNLAMPSMTSLTPWASNVSRNGLRISSLILIRLSWFKCSPSLS